MAEHERSGLRGVNDPEQIRKQIKEYLRSHPDQGEESSSGVERGEQQADLDLVIRGRQILTTAGVVAREVGIRDGRIVAIEPLGSGLTAASTVELADDETLIPGLVDTHVHVNEPGRTEWEGFASATKAAAAGGVTTIIDMPLNSIPPRSTCPLAAQAPVRPASGVRGRRVLGRRGARQSGRSALSARRGRLRLQVLPVVLRGGRVPPARS